VQEFSAELAQEYGVSAVHSKMDNGELRYRLVAADGSAYVRVEASAEGGWQNSHYHKEVLETYIIQKEWAAFVELDAGNAQWKIMKPGDVYTTRRQVPHNVYLPAHAVIHVVKHGGDGVENDWYSSEMLDSLTKHLSETEISQAAR
jgi:mannose-6-phosphate isomerase-like protein (cupin superfamily)